jgi:hypothetical protein
MLGALRQAETIYGENANAEELDWPPAPTHPG